MFETISSPKIISFLLIGSGATFLFIAIIAGIRLKSKLPEPLQYRWLLLIWLMVFFFCGHLLIAWLLWHDFAFPHILIASSIFFGGTFSLFLIALTRASAKAFWESKSKLTRASATLKIKDSMLSREITAHSKTEAELERSNTLFLKDLFEMMIEVLANRDQYTFDHALHVASISKIIGKEMNLGEDELDILELGCLVHDIGKTAIPDDILLKPDRFDNQDRKIMDYHPLIGAKLITRHIQDDRITDIILKHHERLDGSGYPFGLKSEDIGILPRIVGVADTYDALVSKRPYKAPFSHEKAMDVLRDEVKDGKLDKDVVRVFSKAFKNHKLLHSSLPITAGFMKDIELFRSRAYFREPLSDFYNYRYLLSLDDAGFLAKEDLAYDLILIRFPDFNSLQLDIGYAVADQVADELGHNLLEIVAAISHKRKYYDGSAMFFKKGLDYLVYSECEEQYSRSELLDRVTRILDQAETDWHLVYTISSRQFSPGTPVVQAICRLFSETLPKSS